MNGQLSKEKGALEMSWGRNGRVMERQTRESFKGFLKKGAYIDKD